MKHLRVELSTELKLPPFDREAHTGSATERLWSAQCAPAPAGSWAPMRWSDSRRGEATGFSSEHDAVIELAMLPFTYPALGPG